MPSLTVNGESLYYAESGFDGPMLVLMHGSGGDHTTWSPQLAGLSAVARVVAVDLPGHARRAERAATPSPAMPRRFASC